MEKGTILAIGILAAVAIGAGVIYFTYVKAPAPPGGIAYKVSVSGITLE
jgi:hypothetical protein